MYLPTAFKGSDALAWELIEAHPFGVLVEPRSGAVAHVPFVIGRTAGQPDRLRGHVAARNPIAASLAGARLTAVFTGPNGYVSPLWYERPERHVPTWNYVTAQVVGTASVLDADAARVLLDDLCVRFEEPGGYRTEHIARELLDALVAEIVAFEIHVEHIEGKFKLSQNRRPEDRTRVMDALKMRGAADDLAMLEWMQRASS